MEELLPEPIECTENNWTKLLSCKLQLHQTHLAVSFQSYWQTFQDFMVLPETMFPIYSTLLSKHALPQIYHPLMMSA